jgi:hypothetical protein
MKKANPRSGEYQEKELSRFDGVLQLVLGDPRGTKKTKEITKTDKIPQANNDFQIILDQKLDFKQH